MLLAGLAVVGAMAAHTLFRGRSPGTGVTSQPRHPGGPSGATLPHPCCFPDPAPAPLPAPIAAPAKIPSQTEKATQEGAVENHRR